MGYRSQQQICRNEPVRRAEQRGGSGLRISNRQFGMPDQLRKDQPSLSEISHLFLSSVREKQTAGAPRPQRRPPPPSKRDTTIDLTPEEFARAFTNEALQISSHESAPPIQLRVSAVISSHLGDRPAERAREYAAHLCASGRQRVGLIEIDPSELRVTLLESA